MKNAILISLLTFFFALAVFQDWKKALIASSVGIAISISGAFGMKLGARYYENRKNKKIL